MAFIERKIPMLIPSPSDLQDPGFLLPGWINVSTPVGENVWLTFSVDTMLVQFLLFEIYNRGGLRRPVKPLVTHGKPPDGLYGKVTKEWIQHFQSDGTAQGGPLLGSTIHPVKPDGVVSVARGSDMIKRTFTIYKLNKSLAMFKPLKFMLLLGSAVSNERLKKFIEASHNWSTA